MAPMIYAEYFVDSQGARKNWPDAHPTHNSPQLGGDRVILHRDGVHVPIHFETCAIGHTRNQPSVLVVVCPDSFGGQRGWLSIIDDCGGCECG